MTGTVIGQGAMAETTGIPETIGVTTEGAVEMRALGTTVEMTVVVERVGVTVGNTAVVERVDGTTGTIVAIVMTVAAGVDEIPVVNTRRNERRSRCALRGGETLRLQKRKIYPRNRPRTPYRHEV